jgi:tetratricopeptide (TPR) repeat protein
VDSGSEKSKVFAVYLILTLIICAVFAQVRSFKFVNYDDILYVNENVHIATGLKWNNIVWVFTHQHAGHWHPLTGLSHMLDCQLFDLNADAHHIVNLLFHIVNALLLLTVLRKMTGALWQSAFVAAAFAIHPMHVESVAWISERKDVLSTFFWILTMAAYLRYVKNPTTGRYVLTLVFFVMGLMSKPMLVTLPFTLLLLDYWPLNRLQFEGKRQAHSQYVQRIWLLVREKIPFFILTIASSIITLFVFKVSGQIKSMDAVPALTRLKNVVISYAVYVEKLFWPENLAVYYPYDLAKLSTVNVLLAAAALLAVTILVVRNADRHKYLLVGWLWYVGTLIPVIGLVQVGDQAMADRYSYVPFIGLFIIVAWGISDLLAGWKYRKILLGFSSIIVISALSVCTWLQTSCWRDSQTLFEHALKVTTRNYVAYNCLGSAYITQDKFDKAVELLHRCLQIKPNYAWAYHNLGVAYTKLKRYEQAVQACKQAIRIEPKNSWTYYTLGVAYDKLGRYREAMEAYKNAVTVEPYYADAYYNLGLACAELGRYQDAVQAYEQAIRIRPDDADAYCNLASAYGQLGQFQKEIDVCEQALKINPDLAEAYYNLGTALGQLGRYAEAIQACKQAIKIKPDYTEAHYNLGAAFLLAGDKNAALEQYKILKSLDPNTADKLHNLIKE